MDGDLYAWPDLYDLVSPVDPEMERFYLDVAGGAGRRTLELACGTGRLTLPLARSGAAVTGGDLSPVMLAEAESRAEAAELNITFAQLDMRDFDLDRGFNRIMVAANSLLHLTTTTELVGFLRSVGRHLEPDGLLAFDIFVPSAQILSMPPGQRGALGTFDHATLGRITVEETIAYDPITQISHADWYWSRPGQPDFRHTQLQMRQIYPQELPLLLEHGGFRLVERFGGFDRSPLAAHSLRQVVLCAPLQSAHAKSARSPEVSRESQR